MTDQARASLSRWWRQQGHWKWWTLGIFVVIVIGAISGSKNKKEPLASSPAVRPFVQRIVPSMISRNEAFWQQLTTDQRTELAKDCSSASAKAAKIAGQITEQYGKEAESIYSIAEVCTNVMQSDLREHEEHTQKEQEKVEKRKEERIKKLKENIEHRTFVAADASVREYVASALIGEKLREVSCHMETECTVVLDDYTPRKAGKIATFFGLAQSIQEQLLEDPDKIFAALFADPHMRKATIISWDELETNGGKSVRWPAISVVCDASAAKQIDWEKVSPAGVEELCKVTLLPNGPPQ